MPSKKKKTPLSEYIRLNCTEPAKKVKNKAIENNRPNDARIAAITEVNCRIAEESFKK
jgi:hypothetical protein